MPDSISITALVAALQADLAGARAELDAAHTFIHRHAVYLINKRRANHNEVRAALGLHPPPAPVRPAEPGLGPPLAGADRG